MESRFEREVEAAIAADTGGGREESSREGHGRHRECSSDGGSRHEGRKSVEQLEDERRRVNRDIAQARREERQRQKTQEKEDFDVAVEALIARGFSPAEAKRMAKGPDQDSKSAKSKAGKSKKAKVKSGEDEKKIKSDKAEDDDSLVTIYLWSEPAGAVLEAEHPKSKLDELKQPYHRGKRGDFYYIVRDGVEQPGLHAPLYEANPGQFMKTESSGGKGGAIRRYLLGKSS